MGKWVETWICSHLPSTQSASSDFLSLSLFETNPQESDVCINFIAGYRLLGAGDSLMWPEGGQREVTDRDVGKDVSGNRGPVVGEIPGKATDLNYR